MSLNEHGVGVAVLDGADALIVAEYRPTEGGVDGWRRALRAAVQDHGLQRCPCVAVVPRDSYQLQQLEAPAVPDEELATAVRWRLKDVVEVPLEQAVTDVVTVPPGPSRSVSSMLYGVVARRERMDEYASVVEQAGLHPVVLEIRELVIRNIAALVPEQGGGVAVLAVDADEGLLVISREETFYLGRSLEIGADDLQAGDSGTVERLALEVQRSLDYYDSQLYGAPPSQVLLLPLTEFDDDAVARELDRQLGVRVAILEMEDWLQSPSGLSAGQQQRAALAIGAVLRHRRGSLA